jgi:hypothetical protein
MKSPCVGYCPVAGRREICGRSRSTNRSKLLTLRDQTQTTESCSASSLSLVAARALNSRFAGQHVELAGKLLPARGSARTGVIVKTIRLLQDGSSKDEAQLQILLHSLGKAPVPTFPLYPTSILPFANWQPVPVNLDEVETIHGMQLRSCIAKSQSTPSREESSRAEQCRRKSEVTLSAEEAANVLAEWVIVPKDFWFNHFSHTDVYTRWLNLRERAGKGFILEVQPYGVGMVVFDDGSGAYIVSRCNAAAIKPKDNKN